MKTPPIDVAITDEQIEARKRLELMCRADMMAIAESMKGEENGVVQNIQADLESDIFVKNHRETKIHRIFRVDYFEDLIGVNYPRTATNVFAKVSSWEDLNEGIRYKLINHFSNGDVVDSYEEWLSRTYGQCWSLNDESNNCYMWHTYHPGQRQELVQVTTTIGRLWDSIQGSNTPNGTKLFLYCGKVGYRNLAKLRARWERTTVQQQASDGPHYWQRMFAESLFSKNKPYFYEKEIRMVGELIPKCTSPCVSCPQLFSYAINPVNLILRVVASPFMSPDRFKCLECKMNRSALGGRHLLEKSKLFI